jgi:hypothetical protein
VSLLRRDGYVASHHLPSVRYREYKKVCPTGPTTARRTNIEIDDLQRLLLPYFQDCGYWMVPVCHVGQKLEAAGGLQGVWPDNCTQCFRPVRK